ncbi:MAG: hypothetical protein DRP32_01710 [Thermotogae bacterium]|uniref:hypothetical protein n=1 Tax=Kosmotoga sp. TaxID=1955248 RepID=UPI000F1B3772|nr:hypothetical protein [Kosmotoga sp.]MCD6159545.1 hypothetical protein [Kosmotoga sp.]RKX50742.1 MAG: hypothetical protein DRP32_01710 [Thermotogota bacterium]
MKFIVLILLMFLPCAFFAGAGLDIEKAYEIIESVQPDITPETSILDVILKLTENNTKDIYAIYSNDEGNWCVITENASMTLDGTTLSLLASETLTQPYDGKPKVSITDALSLIFLSETGEPQAIFLEEVNTQLTWQILAENSIVSVDTITPAILKREGREAKLREIHEKLITHEKKEHPEKPVTPSSKKPAKPPKKGKEGNKN